MVVGRLSSPGAPGSQGAIANAGPTTAPSGLTGSVTPPPTLVVDVVGAVRHPGVYTLPDGARVRDAVAAAGGLDRSAERVGVNLAAHVVDGEQVLVPTRGVPRAAGAGAGSARPDQPVSLNGADAAALETLPGIGPAMAARIVGWRGVHGPFRSIDGLVDVPGIGPRLVARIRARLTL